MQKFIQDYEQENTCDIKIKEYLNNYLKELQRHFDVSDRKMRIILYKIYKDLSPFNIIKKFMKNKISMLKSVYKRKDKHGN